MGEHVWRACGPVRDFCDGGNRLIREVTRRGAKNCVDGLSPRVRGNQCSHQPLPLRVLHRVYPRVCGGTLWPQARSGSCWGLSPRVRGNLLGQVEADVQSRSIPACAGEPSAWTQKIEHGPVYPRVCGGTDRAGNELRKLSGLSPRVRGNREAPDCTRNSKRSIPACAGEPPGRRSQTGPSKVYPRVCGGTYRRRLIGTTDLGLSPRVRGNQYPALPGKVSWRSIPACAGEPFTSTRRQAGNRVYPRVCGGTSTSISTHW